MVSALVSSGRPLRGALLALIAAWFALAACSKSDCQAGECTAAAAGSGGSLPAVPSCQVNSECQLDQGEACVEGTCRAPCHSHFDCQGDGECTSGSDSDGTQGHYCDLAEPEPPGRYYARCPSGQDADCDAAGGFFCVSAGAGDLDSYCTTDCTDDSTCRAGFTCAPLTRPPCADTCGLKGTPKDRLCIPSDQIGPGKAFQCGSRGVTRSVCRPRKFCNSCETDADCLASADQICAKDQSGSKICTKLCDIKHPSCPWGNAATCGIWDKDLNLATCAHRFGQCTGTGKGCEPCLKDIDCGDRGVCTASNFTGEHWCVDFRVTCACGAAADANGLCAGGGCPMSPSGLSMTCLDTTPTMPDSGVCVGANTNSGLLSSTASPQTAVGPHDSENRHASRPRVRFCSASPRANFARAPSDSINCTAPPSNDGRWRLGVSLSVSWTTRPAVDCRRRRSHQRRKEGNAPNRMVVVGGPLLAKELLRMILKVA